MRPETSLGIPGSRSLSLVMGLREGFCNHCICKFVSSVLRDFSPTVTSNMTSVWTLPSFLQGLQLNMWDFLTVSFSLHLLLHIFHPLASLYFVLAFLLICLPVRILSSTASKLQ